MQLEPFAAVSHQIPDCSGLCPRGGAELRLCWGLVSLGVYFCEVTIKPGMRMV